MFSGQRELPTREQPWPVLIVPFGQHLYSSSPVTVLNQGDRIISSRVTVRRGRLTDSPGGETVSPSAATRRALLASKICQIFFIVDRGCHSSGHCTLVLGWDKNSLAGHRGAFYIVFVSPQSKGCYNQGKEQSGKIIGFMTETWYIECRIGGM